MKKRTILLLLILSTVCITGCGKQETVSETTPISTPVPTQVTEVSNLFTPVEERDTIIKVTEDLELEGLREELEKKDASAQAQYNVMNRMKRLNADEDQKSLFCVDQDTGVVYFVNQNKDWYLYRLKDGEAELAVALPAKEIYIWGGTVYFMIESYGIYELDGIKSGDIFAYTPADGTVRFVYAASELGDIHQKLLVNENGIYFSGGVYETMEWNGTEYNVLNSTNYLLPFGSTEPVEDNKSMVDMGMDDYCFGFTSQGDDIGKLRLIMFGRTKEVPDKELEVGTPWFYCLLDEKLYYTTNGNEQIAVKNLTTGETKTYDCVEIGNKIMEQQLKKWGGTYVEPTENYLDIMSFTRTEEYIWVNEGRTYLFRIHPESEEMVAYRLEGKEYTIGNLYTDGKQLYAMYSPTLDGEQYLVQILTDDTGWDEERQLETLGIKYLTE